LAQTNPRNTKVGKRIERSHKSSGAKKVAAVTGGTYREGTVFEEKNETYGGLGIMIDRKGARLLAPLARSSEGKSPLKETSNGFLNTKRDNGCPQSSTTKIAEPANLGRYITKETTTKLKKKMKAMQKEELGSRVSHEGSTV